jgi:DNA-binding NtrC family response regulator
MKPIAVNARLVCATNRNLEKMVKKGEFRDDLFYRLNVIRIQLPSLRERADDVPILLNHFLEEFAEENGLTTPIPSDQALSILRSYSWPGNVRELRNFCENMVVLKRGSEITEYDLDPRFSAPTDLLADERPPGENLSVEENQKRLLRNALVRAGGNRTKAAELMGVSRRTLHRKLDRWPELDVRES